MSKEEANLEALHIHIEGLQATLTKRNARIAELEARLANPSEDAAKAYRKGYKEGWKSCAGQLMEVTRKTANELSKVRKEAFQIYLEGEQK